MEKEIKKSLPIVRLDKKDQQTQERLSKWVEAQSNYSLSIITLIENMIDRFGYTDVTNHDVLRKLYTERIYYKNESNLRHTYSTSKLAEESGRTDFTEGNYAGSLNELVRKNEISIVKRGVYRLAQNFSSTMPLDKQCFNILTNAISELQKTANKVDVLSITEEELKTIQKIKKVIANLTSDLELFKEE